MKKLIFLLLSFSIVMMSYSQDCQDSLLSVPANEIDTSYLNIVHEKKNRIVGIFHSPNQRINGLSIGWGKFGDGLNYNVNTNGLRLEVFGTSFFSFMFAPALIYPPGSLKSDSSIKDYIPDLKTEYEMKHIRYTNRYEKTNGISASLFGSFEGENHTINGMQFSGIMYNIIEK